MRSMNVSQLHFLRRRSLSQSVSTLFAVSVHRFRYAWAIHLCHHACCACSCLHARNARASYMQWFRTLISCGSTFVDFFRLLRRHGGDIPPNTYVEESLFIRLQSRIVWKLQIATAETRYPLADFTQCTSQSRATRQTCRPDSILEQ